MFFNAILNGLPSSTLFEIISIVVITTVLAYFARLLKQPLIPAYILTGIILGPFGLGLIRNQEIILTLAEIGIAFLLFFVGLEINIRKLEQVSLVASIGALTQVLLTFVFGFVLAGYLGFSQIASIYIGLVVAFSSTMVVVKLLSDKDELDTLHGRLILGFLLVQDLIVFIVLGTIGTLNNLSFSVLFEILLKGAAFFLAAILLTKVILPRIFNFAAKSEELLFLCSITLCFAFSFFAMIIGFSIVLGAFIAGLCLATLPYSLDIAGKIRPLKDFFALLFFVSLGMELFFTNLSAILKPLLYLLAAVIILKPFIVLIITSIFGYEKRVSFLTSISLAQVSEFSLIIALFGFKAGHIGSEIFSLTVLLAIITISITSYFIQYDDKIYNVFGSLLNWLSKISFRKEKLEYLARGQTREVILFGCHRMGSVFLHAFEKLKKRVLVVDYNPEIIRKLMKEKRSCLYGELMNEEILHKSGVDKARVIISTVADQESNLYLIDYVRKFNSKALVFVTAKHLREVLELYQKGADYVIFPHLLSGERVSTMLREIISSKKYLSTIRKKHIKHLLEIDLFDH